MLLCRRGHVAQHAQTQSEVGVSNEPTPRIGSDLQVARVALGRLVQVLGGEGAVSKRALHHAGVGGGAGQQHVVHP